MLLLRQRHTVIEVLSGALPNSSFFGGMSMGAMLGTTSLGHVIGIASIQGLAATGVL